MTHDVDLVLALAAHQIQQFEALFSNERFYCPPMDALRIESHRQRRGHFNLLDTQTGLRADVYLAGDDPVQRYALEHARTVDLDAVALAPWWARVRAP